MKNGFLHIDSNMINYAAKNKEYRKALAFAMYIYVMNPNTIFTITRDDMCSKWHLSSRKLNELLLLAIDYNLIQYDYKTHRIQRFSLSGRYKCKVNIKYLTKYKDCETWIIKLYLMMKFENAKKIYNLYKDAYNPSIVCKISEVHKKMKTARKAIKRGKLFNYYYYGHSYKNLAEELCVSVCTIRNIIADMIKSGLITSKPNYKRTTSSSLGFSRQMQKDYKDKGFKGYILPIRDALYIQYGNYYDLNDNSFIPNR